MTACQINNPSSEHIANILRERDGLTIKFADYNNAPMAQIIEFRERQYLAREIDYLCGDLNQEHERRHRLDERSQHFWIEINSEIVGTLRATPYPFELMEVGEYFRKTGDTYQNHLEFGRLIIDSDSSIKISARKLMAAAFLHGLQSGYSGIVAVCRTPQKRFFERFGLLPLNKTAVILPERKSGAYWMLEGDCASISRSVVDRIEIRNHYNTEFVLV